MGWQNFEGCCQLCKSVSDDDGIDVVVAAIGEIAMNAFQMECRVSRLEGETNSIETTLAAAVAVVLPMAAAFASTLVRDYWRTRADSAAIQRQPPSERRAGGVG